ncbi:MAG: hypothetical protein GY724_12830 [Actinomycetia bacterium]|nr:hypothetical protein [Actinomycetes bacterium]
MLVALTIVAMVAAIGLLVLYLQGRSSAAEFREQAGRREAALKSERTDLTEATTRLERELTVDRGENRQLREQNNTATSEIRRLGGELDEARSAGVEQASRLDRQAEEIAVHIADKGALEARVETAETAAAAALARTRGIAIRDGIDLGHAQPETLWDLELTRSERTWRTSVATNPAADDSPFEHTDDPVRLAVEIEAGALRENVGAFTIIDWQSKTITKPAHAHLVVRVAQELLEVAARSPEPSRLVVTGGDEEIVLSLEALEDGVEVINIIPPRVTSDLVELRDEVGVSLTVKAE